MRITPQFVRGNGFGNSTHRGDFQHYSSTDYQPDVSTRRKGVLRSDVRKLGFVLLT